MGADEGMGWAPNGAPLDIQRDDHWRHFDNSVNAVSFGFVATAILISMFLVMAIFERFLRPTSSSALTPSSAAGGRHHRHLPHDIEQSRIGFTGKLFHPSPKVSVNAKEVSVLMPGENMPTFIAHPAPVSVPVPCPPEPILWPPHQHYSFPNGFRHPISTATASGSV
ncbi:OLC1v1021625C1 [Oldenlandia corymbosa var. corymbosa]|uniref:OLC1v1021625C1 n=1 Tax=Oldenlandia corymbosa var. corymbosa TaxID=529605 RepID=A0AAV1BYK3_OLDCO|nr:OLC1v1021625C1 [Oldenlandia corymbosa var. corymbosa]